MNLSRIAGFAVGLAVLVWSSADLTLAQTFRTPQRGSVRMVAAEEPVETAVPEPEAESSDAPPPIPAPTTATPPPMTLEEAITTSPYMMSDPSMPMYGQFGACGPNGCPPGLGYAPSFGIFFDSLFLRPGNSEVVYAIEKTGCDPALSTPTGPVGSTVPTTSFGFHTGLNYSRNPGQSVELAYTWYEATTSSSIGANFQRVLDSQVTYPGQPSCGANSLSASASDLIRFQFIDLDFRRAVVHDCNRDIYVMGGLRYGDLNETFTASQNTGTATGLSTVDTSIDFSGPGIRFGAGGERTGGNGWLLYGRGAMNVLTGKMKRSYQQVNQLGGNPPIALSDHDYRLLPILEAEVGFGWRSRSQRWQLMAGYQLDAWFNTLTTGDYIQGVRSGITDSLNSTQTFDGIVARIEYRR